MLYNIYFHSLPAQFSIEHNWMRSGAVGLAALTIAMILSIRPIRNAAFEFFLVTHIIFIMYVTHDLVSPHFLIQF